MKSPNNTITALHQSCPNCPSSDAYCVYEDGHGYCYSCNYYSTAGKREKDREEVYTYEYLPQRGLTRRTVEFYDIKTKVDGSGKPCSVGFRYPDGRLKVRSCGKKDFYWTEGPTEQEEKESKGHNNRLFGRDKFPQGGTSLIITEGEYDAPSCYQVLHVPSISVSSSSAAASDISGDRSFVNSYEKIYLGFDSDPAGKRALADVARLFDYNKIRVLDFSPLKDANDYVQQGKEDELRNIFHNARRYLPETVVSIDSASVQKILSEDTEEGVPYPFKTLNEMTYGMRRGESVLITALEGVGKTELMHAIEYQLLRETDDNVAAIFLETPKKRHLQSLAGIHLKCPAHLPDANIPEAAISNAISEITKKDSRLYLYNHFGSDDPNVLIDTIRFLVTTCNVRWVLLDHITMAVSGITAEADERRALDYLSNRLEMMCVELNFGLIMVSHVNDSGQTRGSRNISKIANIRIDATRNVLSGDEQEQRTLNLSLGKNRFAGRSGPAGRYLFDPKLRQYTEIEDGRCRTPAN